MWALIEIDECSPEYTNVSIYPTELIAYTEAKKLIEKTIDEIKEEASLEEDITLWEKYTQLRSDNTIDGLKKLVKWYHDELMDIYGTEIVVKECKYHFNQSKDSDNKENDGTYSDYCNQPENFNYHNDESGMS